MDDLAEIRKLRPPTPLPEPADIVGARQLLLDACDAAPATRQHRRTGWVAAGASVAAAAIAVALVVVPRHAQPQPIQVLDVAQILHYASEHALAEPDTVPRPDQFVYTRSADGEQLWRSVDGTHDGLTINSAGVRSIQYGCVAGRQQAVDKRDRPETGKTEPCTPDPAYDPTLSTDPNVLMRQLNDGPYDPKRPDDVNRVAKGVLDLVASSYLRPAVRAALFESVTTIPGLRVVHSVADGVGRPGVGIAWTFGGGSNVLVFDAKTYEFLGVTTEGVHGEKGSGARLRLAIVDHAGQTPN